MTEPFVLLDDARPYPEASAARLYQQPLEIVVARRPDEVIPALDRVAALHAQGHWLAGMAAYEAGLVLEPRLAPRAAHRWGADGPLVWFGAFAGYTSLAAADVPRWLAEHAGADRTARIGPLTPALSPGGYGQMFSALEAAIHAGDVYQVNATFMATGRWHGDPMAIYAALRTAGGGGHGALVWDGDAWLFSHSPELFFEIAGGTITARPMKGTRPRGPNPEADAALAAALAASAKDRAENLMIVDLTRNDLARIAAPGSVRVEAPFAIESYPSVHQLVSTVRAELIPGADAAAVLRAIFPCGSITGAPKLRAMELIDDTERGPRGAYCGAIGHIDPAAAVTPGPESLGAESLGPENLGRAAFNVAIRTLRLRLDEPGATAGQATLGVGSGLVADSRHHDEWRECLVKGGFVLASAAAAFDLIETMRFTPDAGIALFEGHMTRISTSAAALGFAFDRHQARNRIQALCFDVAAAVKLRLLLSRDGAIALEAVPIDPVAAGEVVCAVLPMPVDPGDLRLRHKTSDRGFYEAALAVAAAVGAGEALFIRDDGLLTEGCRTNIFARRGGRLVTPPARLGLLPGVLRQSLLDAGDAEEGELTMDDLAGGFMLGNALRGLRPARLLA